MTKTDEIAKIILRAIQSKRDSDTYGVSYAIEMNTELAGKAAAEIEGLLHPAQPTLEPVAWRWKFPGDGAWTISTRYPGADVEGVQPLYAAQPPAAPVARDSQIAALRPDLAAPVETDWQVMYEAETRISAKQAAEIVQLREQIKSGPRSSAGTSDAVHFGNILRDEAARLRARADELDPLTEPQTVPKHLLDGRDDFIVSKGLWSEFMSTLPRPHHSCAHPHCSCPPDARCP